MNSFEFLSLGKSKTVIMKQLTLIFLTVFFLMSCEKEDYCTNGLLDIGEESVDCGGSCGECDYMNDDCQVTMIIEMINTVDNGMISVKYKTEVDEYSYQVNPVVNGYWEQTVQPNYFMPESGHYTFFVQCQTTYDCSNEVITSGNSFYANGVISFKDYEGNLIVADTFTIAKTNSTSLPVYPGVQDDWIEYFHCY